MSTIFAKHPGATFRKGELIRYFETLNTQGWMVFSGAKQDEFILQLGEENDINISPASNKTKGWLIQSHRRGSVQKMIWATTMPQLTGSISSLAAGLGFNISSAPTKIRTSTTTPLTNMKSVVGLAANTSVVSIYDPYFDDGTVAYLNSLCNLGLGLNSTIQVLAANAMRSRLSTEVIDSFASENGSSIEIRLIDKGHRRFLILSDNSCIVLGWSMNSWNKNEAAHREGNGVEDIKFFSEKWAEARPCFNYGVRNS